ncbi:MAG: SH3 domain-containing protein [Clostridia bacterium]|nr:SH3 domain-containing protein [Clostridia bacterium]
MKPRTLLMLTLLFCLALCPTLAEPAWVQTPGGPLNMRKKQSANAAIIAAVPNHSRVEAEETAGEWTRITYQKKTGYVKTEFLLMASAMAGKTVYADAHAVITYAAPDAAAPILAVFNTDDPIFVERIAGDWAVIIQGEQRGYAAVEDFSAQRQTPAGALDFIPEAGVTVRECTLRRGDAETAVLPAGTAVTVAHTPSAGEACLAETPQGWGWVSRAGISLAEYPDEAVSLPGGITATEATAQAEAALKKQFKQFGRQRMYSIVTLYKESAYRCGFFSDDGQLLYAAVLDPQGALLAQADYTGFAVPVHTAELLPSGEIMVDLSGDSLAVGDMLDIAVSAWTQYQCQYSLEGPSPAETAPGGHFTAAWRPRQAGDYTLTVTVTDEDGLSAAWRREITVTPAVSQTAQTIYSQKDGWWLDKAYRASTLDRSGCAIFTLSHALSRMGLTGDDLLPQSLAQTFALCLTPDGTNNERLIREAAAAYGFKTRSELLTDARQIANYLRNGAMFSFSIARGHIALAAGISQDGTMVRVVDSAPFATFDRIVGDSLYYQTRSGGFRAAVRMEDLPGARWYLDTDDYGGLEYWLRLSYVAKRGARLIQPAD